MIGRVDNLGVKHAAAAHAPNTNPAGNGQSRYEVDARALGKPLPAAQPINSRFANGADRHFDGQNLYGGMTKAGNPFVSSDDHLLATDRGTTCHCWMPSRKRGDSPRLRCRR